MLHLANRFGPFLREVDPIPARMRQVYGAVEGEPATGAVMTETDEKNASQAMQLLSQVDLLEFLAGTKGTPVDAGSVGNALVPTEAQKQAVAEYRANLPAALWNAAYGRDRVGRGRMEAARSRVRGSQVSATFCSQPTYKPTAANLCLRRVVDKWAEVYRAGGLAAYCKTNDPMTCGREPWKEMPAAAKRFQKTGSIANPGVEGVDFQVLSFQVPNAWDGVLITITNQWDGAGFVDGSGDLVWRVQFDNQWFKDLENILITLGRLENPYELEGAGYRLLTNQTIRYFVRLGAGALARLDPNGRVTCACSGWFYPRG